MLKRERQTFILHQVNLHNRVLSSDLSLKLKVSEDTVRRDLQELAEGGSIIKVHGGALSKSFYKSIDSEPVYAKDAKIKVAEKAVSLIHDGMFVLTSGGTTIIELAKMLPKDLRATFITVSLQAAVEYVHHPHIDLIFIGDKISKNAQISIGAEAIRKIGMIRADLCLLGINALDLEMGLTDNDWEVAEVKKAMIASSAKVAALTISEKINAAQNIRICPVETLDILVTEKSPEDPLLLPYADHGIQII